MSQSLVSENPIQKRKGMNTITGCCVFCQNTTLIVCQRCGDFYCSPVCQRKDWQRHRYICSAIPPLIHAADFFDVELLSAEQAQTKAKNGKNSVIGNGLVAAPPATKSPVQLELKKEKLKPSLAQQQKANQVSNSNDNMNKQANKQQDQVQHPQSPSPQLQHQQKSSIAIEVKLPKNDSRVVICGFRSVNRCFVREVSPAINAAYVEVIMQIKQFGETAKALVKVPKVNSFALTKKDKIMHRVRILSLHLTIFHVLFVDYGNNGFCKLEDLYEISNELIALPKCAIVMNLDNVQNYDCTESLHKWLFQHVGKEYRIIYSNKDEKFRFVKLFHWETNKSLNDEVNDYCLSTKINGVGDERPYEWSIDDIVKKEKKTEQKESDNQTVAEIEKFVTVKASPIINENSSKSLMVANHKMVLKNTIPKNNNLSPVLKACFKFQQMQWAKNGVDVFIVDNSNVEYGYVGCLPTYWSAKLDRTAKYLKHFNDELPYSPVLHEYVIAKHLNIWYRGKVLAVDKSFKNEKSSFILLLIDYTTEVTLTNDFIRRYPNDLCHDIHTSICLIADIPKAVNERHAQLIKNRLKLQTVIHVENFTYLSENMALITCTTLVDELKKIMN